MIPYRIIPGNTLPLISLSKQVFGEALVDVSKSEINPEKKTITFSYLSDIWALDKTRHSARTGPNGAPYILDKALYFCGKELRSGLTTLIFDMSAEGHAFHKQSFDDIHCWCASNKIDITSIAILSQNRCLEHHYKNHYGTEPGVHFLIYDQFIAGLALFLSDDGDLFTEKIGFEKIDATRFENRISQSLFLSLNATPRPIRVIVLSLLSHHGLLEDTTWSLLKERSGKGHFSRHDSLGVLKDLKLEFLAEEVALLYEGPPKIIDQTLPANANSLIWNINLQAYLQTLMSIVVETDFGGDSIVRVTEKSIKAFAMGHPTVVVGNPNSLTLIRQFGFSTFDPLIPEDYDGIINPADRLTKIVSTLQEVRTRILSKDVNYRRSLLQIGEMNCKHALSGGFLRAYQSAVELPLLKVFSSLVAG